MSKKVLVLGKSNKNISNIFKKIIYFDDFKEKYSRTDELFNTIKSIENILIENKIDTIVIENSNFYNNIFKIYEFFYRMNINKKINLILIPETKKELGIFLGGNSFDNYFDKSLLTVLDKNTKINIGDLFIDKSNENYIYYFKNNYNIINKNEICFFTTNKLIENEFFVNLYTENDKYLQPFYIISDQKYKKTILLSNIDFKKNLDFTNNLINNLTS